MSIANAPFVVGPASEKELSIAVGECADTPLQAVQAALLSDVLLPVLDLLHPDDNYFVGTGTGICWQYTKPDPEAGYVWPGWFYVPNLPRLLDGRARHRFMFWEEAWRPFFVVDFVSGDGAKERDTTPFAGTFWIQERAVRAVNYVLWDAPRRQLEVYERWHSTYRPQETEASGRFAVPEMGISLGVWHGRYQGYTADWLRAWDNEGKLLPTPQERAEKLAAKLCELGVDPNSV